MIYRVFIPGYILGERMIFTCALRVFRFIYAVITHDVSADKFEAANSMMKPQTPRVS